MDEARFLQLISRPDPTVEDRVMRGCLRVVSGAYGGVVKVRNALFDRGWKRSESVGVPVISIGNLTTGGTGKTPLVAFVVDWLKRCGKAPGIVSRGYRAVGGTNDEKLVLERLCPGTPHVQNPDRVTASQHLLANERVDVIVADDAFQHRRLKRDLDIVLIDALNPWGYGSLLPRGLLRELPAALCRAGIVILTRADQIDAETKQSIWDEVRRWRPETEPVEVAFHPSSVRSYSGEPVECRDDRVVGFCGIGNPEAFRATCQQAGLNVVGFRAFPDHHHYTERDFAALGALIDRHQAKAFVATLKDVVKLPRPTINGRDVRFIDIAAKVLVGGETLDRTLTQATLFRS